VCGRDYQGQFPRYCLTCGWVFEEGRQAAPKTVPAAGEPHFPQSSPTSAMLPDGSCSPLIPQPSRTPVTLPVERQPLARRGSASRAARGILAACLAVILIAGGAVGLVVGLRSIKHPAPLPLTAAAMRASVALDEEYLTERGKTLASGRTKNAAIYSVSAKLDTTADIVSGTERLLYTNNTGVPQNELVLRMYANSPGVNTTSAEVSVSAAHVDGRDASASLSGSLVRLSLLSTLEPGREALVSMDFKEHVPEVQTSLGGLEQLLGQQSTTGYGVFGRSGNTYDLGYFMPILTSYGPQGWESREAPAFGDVGDFACAYYNVRIDVPSGYTVAATGMPVGDGGSPGRAAFDFRAGPVRDFTAQASPDYSVSSAREGETLVSSYYVKGAADSGKKVLGYARDALKAFKGRFGPYPYRRLNLCEAALAGGAGGMEFAGQIQLAQLLYGSSGPGTNLANGQINDILKSLGDLGGLLGDTLEFTVAHEVCHQWWGLVVGSDSIGHPWQDESLTNYCTVMYVRWQHGADEAKKQYDMQIVMPYATANLMGGGGDMVVDSPISAFSNQMQYTAIVYSKGAMFFAALEKKMGEAAFVKSLQYYYEHYAFRASTPGEFIYGFERSSGNPDVLASLYQRWINERHGGEDIASSVPGMDLLNNLLNNLPGGLDLNNLQDLLDQYMQNGTMPELPDLQDL
jgi:hypothetical protein